MGAKDQWGEGFKIQMENDFSIINHRLGQNKGHFQTFKVKQFIYYDDDFS